MSSENSPTVVGNFLIEGNIGSGKSTFLQRLQQLAVPVTLVPEPVHIWVDYKGHNYLQYFYENPRKWAFAMQQLALNTAAGEYMKVRDSQTLKFFERSVYSPVRIFGQQQYMQGTYTDEEFDLHKKITADIIQWINYDIKGIIYVRTSPEIAQKRVAARQRKEDATIPLEYLEALHQRHEDWLVTKQECPYPVLTFENNSSLILNDFSKFQSEIHQWILDPKDDRIIDPEAY